MITPNANVIGLAPVSNVNPKNDDYKIIDQMIQEMAAVQQLLNKLTKDIDTYDGGNWPSTPEQMLNSPEVKSDVDALQAALQSLQTTMGSPSDGPCAGTFWGEVNGEQGGTGPASTYLDRHPGITAFYDLLSGSGQNPGIFGSLDSEGDLAAYLVGMGGVSSMSGMINPLIH